jgi:hypothetical protein
MFSILRYHTIDPNLKPQYEVKLLIRPKQNFILKKIKQIKFSAKSLRSAII